MEYESFTTYGYSNYETGILAVALESSGIAPDEEFVTNELLGVAKRATISSPPIIADYLANLIDISLSRIDWKEIEENASL